jgi:glycosyl transferase family 1
MHKIYFPLFDHIESASNEMRLTHEGLLAHPQVTLVDRPEQADYLMFCQNHLVGHCPFHAQFRPIKDRYKERTILLDYGDDPHSIFDADDFRWRLYFKRSCVDRRTGMAIDYGNLPIVPTAYCVLDAMAEPPPAQTQIRTIDIACLFDDDISDNDCFKRVRGPLLRFARQFAASHPVAAQLGTVSESGPLGRSRIHPRYKQCLYNSRIILHANPDLWEGDARTWEALASGALLFVDRMYAPIAHPLVDGQHLVYFDVSNGGLADLEQQIVYYLEHEQERARIGAEGRNFVLAHHRSLDRVSAVIERLPLSVPRISIRTPAAPAIDVIVTVAAGYPRIGQYRQFISTLRGAGATCPVLIGISGGPDYEKVRRYLLRNGVNYFIVPPLTPPNKVVNGYRFELYREWLRNLDFRYALLMDFRDAFFQRDPFADVDRVMADCDLYLMSEFQFLTIGNHPNGMNYAWIAEPFGTATADALADRVILNSGAILGRRRALLKFLDACADLTADQDFAFADQGTLNYLAHTGGLDHCGRIKMTRAGVSLVNNCGFTELDLLRQARPLSSEEEAQIAFIPRDRRGRLMLYRNDDGWVLDDDGSVSPVVHQFDRFSPAIDQHVARLSRHLCPDEVFVNDSGRPYRGERYTLSSTAGLKADAVERLIERMAALPVDRKPLLLLDDCFTRGFVFAYGILHNELLFEPEGVRQQFFEPARDAAKCERFCETWGYRAVFVPEAEIFNGGSDTMRAGSG